MNTVAAQPFGSKISAALAKKPVVLQLLRFAAIGAINTALDFIILNYVTKSLNVESGVKLGVLNAISFTAALIQSYFWNRAWAFSQNASSLFQNFYRLVLVGGLGFGAFLAVVFCAAYGASPTYFLLIFIAFIISEIALWILFGLTSRQTGASAGHQFAVFILVSLIGLLINSLIVVIASHFLAPSLNSHGVNSDTVKNIAKALATGVSLIWNFIGYKLFVFKQ